MHELLAAFVHSVGPAIEGVGILVVTWGALEGTVRLVSRAVGALRGQILPPLEEVRAGIGEKMALGLDFFLAGDIIQTIVIPSIESLAMLGGIVAIRTVLSYFLSRDLKELKG
ncbi:MAG: DUF1622 domain-containing protein [Rhodocyclaceae bacterium]|jgi:uncharacterized membrane protein|nr:DUF1622 domain-containing protein [Rhodocyclaceae bacterium]